MLVVMIGSATRNDTATLQGRASEQDEIARALDAARHGLSAAMVIEGEAGVGKTALLDHAAMSATDFHLLRVTGVDVEQDLGFAGLHRLLWHHLAAADGLAERHRRALHVAFGLEEGTHADRFVVGLAVLTLCAELARERPLLCLVDDVQWLDPDSLAALAFVGRRLDADRVVMVLARRVDPMTPSDGPDVLDGLPTTSVAGLSAAATRELLTATVGSVVDPQVSDRLHAETAGNPLALVELAAELDTDQLAGRAPLPDALVLGEGLAARFLARVRSLPPATQTFLLLAAVEPRADAALLLAAAASVAIATDEITRSDDLLVTDDGVRFRHPLIRSAVYSGAADQARRDAHGAFASVLDPATDPDRWARHRAAATALPDETVARALETSADRALGRGGYATVSTLLERAASLTPASADRGRRLLGAAKAALQCGQSGRAARLARAARDEDLDGIALAQSLRLQGALRGLQGRVPTAALLAAARAFAAIDAPAARECVLEAFEAAMVADDGTDATTLACVARIALDQRSDRESPITASEALLDGLATRVAVGYEPAVAPLRAAVGAMCADGELPDTIARLSNLASFAAKELWDEESRRRFFARLIDQQRDRGALEALRYSLVGFADCEMHAGSFDRADAVHEDAKEIAVAIDGPASGWDRVNVEVLAWRGDEQACRTFAASLIELDTSMAGGRGVVAGLARMALVVLELSLARYDAALAHGMELFRDDPLAYGSQVLPSIVEAATRVGDLAAARRALDRLQVRARASGTPWALGMLARAEALASDGPDADGWFGAALDHLGASGVTIERARTHLLYGEWLRRAKRRTDAREQLRVACDLFDAMPAVLFAARAHRELLATGATARKRSVDTARDLTPQEQRIASLASDGLTNAEIAAQLFISLNTVEHHLRNVYRKLGLSSRRQLASTLATGSASAARSG
jgi:DNA-binding CsgD family transcriptional regulator